MELRLMTFNVRNGRALTDGWNMWWLRRRATAAVIAAQGADIIGLQEVYRFQLRYLLRRLGGYGYVGVGRNDGRRRGEHAPVLYRRDRFDLERTETRWLSDTPTVPGSRTWGNRNPRIVTLAWLRDRGEGARLGVANSHFDEASAEARRRSTGALLDWVGALDDRPWMILADLNATADDRAVRDLLAGGYQDALGDRPTHGPGAGTEHAFTGRDDRSRIDFVLVPPPWLVADARIVRDRPKGRLPSDHWPVVADVSSG